MKNKIKLLLKKFLNTKIKTPYIKNINLDLTKIQKRVLISYIDYFSTLNLNKGIYHTNVLESIQIINVFKEKGYVIDIIHCNATECIKFISMEKYDIIFGFGEVFYKISKLNSNAKKIIYVTENHPKFSQDKETERNSYFFERTGKKIKLKRSGVFYKEKHFENIDYAIVMGELEPFEKYEFKKYQIFPTGFLNEKYFFMKRDLKKSRNNFLWLGSTGAIHKGLDLLIEVFSKNKNLNLHICGFNANEKNVVIPKLENIKNYGRINIKNDIFLKLVDSCSYIILPSCSEGCATSILTGMLHSMIPVVIKDTGFSRLKENAIFLNDYKLEILEKEIKELSLREIKDLDHKKIYEYARKNFTLENFTREFNKIIEDILNEE